MPRDGAIIFSDLIGKLDVLRVTCEKRGRNTIAADCPKRKAANFNDRCAARCPDLPKVL